MKILRVPVAPPAETFPFLVAHPSSATFSLPETNVSFHPGSINRNRNRCQPKSAGSPISSANLRMIRSSFVASGSPRQTENGGKAFAGLRRRRMSSHSRGKLWTCFLSCPDGMRCQSSDIVMDSHLSSNHLRPRLVLLASWGAGIFPY
jgi:hypothetical protein